MASQEEERILSIKVKYQDAVDGIMKYGAKVQELKKYQEDLKKKFDEGIIGLHEYQAAMIDSNARIKEAKDSIRVLEKEYRNNLKAQKENEGSLKSLRAELSNATKQYDELSRAEREGAKGKELQEHINAVTLELKEAEAETQRFYRNVGNYENSVKDALSSLREQVQKANQEYEKLVKTEGEHSEAAKKAKKSVDELQMTLEFAEENSDDLNASVMGFVTAGNPWAMTALNMVKQLGSVKAAFGVAANGAVMLGKQLMALMANPIVAFLGILAVAITTLSKGIQSSEDQFNRWKVAMAPLGGLLDFISNCITGLTAGILYAVEAGGKLMNWALKMCEYLPILGDAFKEGNKAVQERIELQKNQIKYEQETRAEIVKSAERENEISELRAKVADRQNYTAAERRKYLEEAIKLEEEQAARKKELAELNLANLEKEASFAENDAEMNNKLAEAKAAVIRADTDYNNKVREMYAQRAELANQEKAQIDAVNKAAQESLKLRKEMLSKEVDAIRQAEDAMLSLIQDGIEKQRREITLSYDREIEDLRKKLSEEENLTAKAKDAIRQTILAKEKLKNEELAKLDDEELQKAIEKEERRIARLLESVKSGSEQEYQLKLQQLANQEAAEMAAMESELLSVQEKEEAKLAIRQKYNLLNEELISEHNNNIIQKQQEAIRLEYETAIAEAGNNELAILELKMQQKQAELDSLHHLEGESIEQFNLRKLELLNEYNEAKQSVADKEVEIEQTKIEAIANITNGIGSVVDALGEKNTAFAKLSKVLALAEIAINTGKALAAGIAQAQSVPFPANIAAIATTVTTILTNIATATKTVNSAKFATGGLVEGEGTATSDSIPAMLSNGESVMTAAATSMFSPLLSAFNQMGGGVPISVVDNNNSAMGEEMLANAVARGMRLAPRPVVSVEEIRTVSNRVELIESLGDI